MRAPHALGAEFQNDARDPGLPQSVAEQASGHAEARQHDMTVHRADGGRCFVDGSRSHEPLERPQSGFSGP